MLANGVRIGVIDEYLYGEQISAYQNDPALNGQFVYSQLAETNIGKLTDGAVEGIIEDKYVGAAIVRHKDLGNLVAVHPTRFSKTPVRIMVSRAAVDEETFERLDASVTELLQSGAIEKVLAQYGNP